MQQDLHLGDMLKARLAEKQQPIQLNLFDDADYVAYEVGYAMNLSLDAVYKLRDSNPHAFYRIKQIRDATGDLRETVQNHLASLINQPGGFGTLRDILELRDHLVKEIVKNCDKYNCYHKSLGNFKLLINQPGGFGPHLGDCYATTY
jgi:hypothetical protein